LRQDLRETQCCPASDFVKSLPVDRVLPRPPFPLSIPKPFVAGFPGVPSSPGVVSNSAQASYIAASLDRPAAHPVAQPAPSSPVVFCTKVDILIIFQSDFDDLSQLRLSRLGIAEMCTYASVEATEIENFEAFRNVLARLEPAIVYLESPLVEAISWYDYGSNECVRPEKWVGRVLDVMADWATAEQRWIGLVMNAATSLELSTRAQPSGDLLHAVGWTGRKAWSHKGRDDFRDRFFKALGEQSAGLQAGKIGRREHLRRSFETVCWRVQQHVRNIVVYPAQARQSKSGFASAYKPSRFLRKIGSSLRVLGAMSSRQQKTNGSTYARR